MNIYIYREREMYVYMQYACRLIGAIGHPALPSCHLWALPSSAVRPSVRPSVCPSISIHTAMGLSILLVTLSLHISLV